MKFAGTLVSPKPNKSFICVEKIVSAIPAVNPTTTGWYKFYDVSKTKCSISTSSTRHNSGNSQSGNAVLLNDAVNDNNKCACRARLFAL